MKRSLILLLLISVCFLFSGCFDSSESSDSGTTGSTDTSGTGGSSGITVSDYATSVGSTASSYSADDIVTNTTFSYTVNIDFTANTAQLGDGTAQAITSEGVALITVDSTSVIVAATTYGITITSTVASAVKYSLSGTLAGTLTVNSSSAYQLYLNGTIINATAGPALDLESAAKVFIVTADGTTNTLTDSSTRSMTMKAALYGKGDMIFSGTGTLSVTGSYKHGIYCNDYIRICSGTYNVTVFARDAIRSVNGFIFDDGNLTITATGTTIDDESKGIKVEGVESAGTGKGYIVINGGYITITSVSKGITAAWDIDEDADTSDTSDDPDPDVTINNGVITITTTGTPYETSTASLSPEGIEGKSDLTINKGYFVINTTDDSLNSGDSMAIKGGYIYCKSSANDAIDTNGTLTISGGVIVAIGSAQPESSFDCDANNFIITGGTFVGIGGATSSPTASLCTQNCIITGSLSGTMALVSSDGTVAFAFTIPQSYSTMILSSPEIKTGTKYTVYTGVTASGVYSFYNLYMTGLDYSGGTAGNSFTITSSVTNSGGTVMHN